MLTIKLPIQNKINIYDYSLEYNSCLRFSYNRLIEGMNEKDIRHLIKANVLFNKFLDSWFQQCAIKEAVGIYERNKNKKIIFGGKKNLELRSKNKITNEQWREFRLYPITIQGETLQKGNRKFNLDIIDNNIIIFKPNRKTKINIQLPKLRKSLKKTLYKIQELSLRKEIPYTIKLTNSFIYIIYDEKILRNNNNNNINLNPNRVFGIDLNPNYIGWSVLEFDTDNNFRIIQTGIIDNKLLNEKLRVSSNDPKQIYQNNKKEFEVFEISKFLIERCLFYKCNKFSIEDLSISTKNHGKGRSFNRLINNCWNRNKLISNLKKHCNINNIELVEVNPAYSSYIGNILHGNKFPDMIASSIEISRRGYHKYQSGWFYPKLISSSDLSNQWKEAINWNYNNWIELAKLIKTSKLSYRSSLNKFNNLLKVFRLNNIKSKVFLYSF